jgi:hypothetical protein
MIPDQMILAMTDKPFNLFGQFNLGTISKMREKLLQIDDKSFYFVT